MLHFLVRSPTGAEKEIRSDEDRMVAGRASGVDLLLDDPAATWDKPAISQVFHNQKAQGYSIRTTKWRYTEWNGGQAGRELYDHQADPDEVTNLASKPKYADIVKRLSKQLAPYCSLRAVSPEHQSTL